VRVGRDESALSGQVHVDGAHVGGKVRPENRKEDRVDRRLAESCFARFRRCQIGQIRKVAPKYLDHYAHEMASVA
jgi:hypothetical protein